MIIIIIHFLQKKLMHNFTLSDQLNTWQSCLTAKRVVFPNCTHMSENPCSGLHWTKISLCETKIPLLIKFTALECKKILQARPKNQSSAVVSSDLLWMSMRSAVRCGGAYSETLTKTNTLNISDSLIKNMTITEQRWSIK